jgi:PIN domain nuclease of toxin-antitoxin system
MSSAGILLDACALIWLQNAQRTNLASYEDIELAGDAGRIFVSPISAWEIGFLSKPRSGRPPSLTFLPTPADWLNKALANPGIVLAPFTSEIALAAHFLPEPFHNDPADRLIVATARRLNVPVVTRDRKILDYADAGHCAAIAC